jgi:hypothetical protein
MDVHSVGRFLLILGIVLAGAGLLLYTGRSPSFLGRLPGDIRIEREHLRLYVPITTSLLLSALLSAALCLLSRLR